MRSCQQRARRHNYMTIRYVRCRGKWVKVVAVLLFHPLLAVLWFMLAPCLDYTFYQTHIQESVHNIQLHTLMWMWTRVRSVIEREDDICIHICKERNEKRQKIKIKNLEKEREQKKMVEHTLERVYGGYPVPESLGVRGMPNSPARHHGYRPG